VKSHEKPFDPHCLHCLVNFTIQAWAAKHGRRADGTIEIDAALAIEKLGDVVGELVYHSHDVATRKRFERFAHKSLERAFQCESTANIVISFDSKRAAA
jgi:hypothetical protein